MKPPCYGIAEQGLLLRWQLFCPSEDKAAQGALRALEASLRAGRRGADALRCFLPRGVFDDVTPDELHDVFRHSRAGERGRFDQQALGVVELFVPFVMPRIESASGSNEFEVICAIAQSLVAPQRLPVVENDSLRDR